MLALHALKNITSILRRIGIKIEIGALDNKMYICIKILHSTVKQKEMIETEIETGTETEMIETEIETETEMIETETETGTETEMIETEIETETYEREVNTNI
jgi:hypothetical protein